jgi:hypothetical protein
LDPNPILANQNRSGPEASFHTDPPNFGEPNVRRNSDDRRRSARLGRLRYGYTRATFEALENRVMLSIVTWTNTSGGDWDTAANWSGGTVPGAGDDVTIDVPGGVAITHSQNVIDAIHSLSASDPITLGRGTLSVASSLSD